jgi:hypothetical protein
MMQVTLSVLVPGCGWRGPDGWSFRLRGRAAGRSGGGAMMVICTRVIRVGLRPVLVAGGGAFHFPGAAACPPGGQQVGAADPAGVAGVLDAAGGDDLLPRGFERGGEAGPVRVGAGGSGGGGHRHAQRLADGQQRP